MLDAIAALPGVTAARRELGELVVEVARSDAYALFTRFRDEFAFAQVMDICGVDFPERAARFDIVYNLLSVTRNERIRVLVQVGDSDSLATVSTLWPSATWWEREIWDLFGVPFDGLADHRRILTDYGFEGHPLRKDFPLTGYVEVHYDDEQKAVVYDKVRLTQEFRNFDFLSPWEGMTTLPGDEKARGDRK
ncbi:NADH-quinone oxidoreductase subunit C [Acidocella aquatica]|uniref:NADH-quinone oxidoreductase subunit C n=1 Tax=Acidocella aquatica TaxID=1922313 RepID=UPI0024E07E54|nr:NADH-quinone oxidoreductase subunit C [Acidocella aquatica]